MIFILSIQTYYDTVYDVFAPLFFCDLPGFLVTNKFQLIFIIGDLCWYL